MKVIVNGEETEVTTGATVVDVLTVLGRSAEARGVAVAINGHVVHKGQWRDTKLADEDRVEVLSAVGGG